MTQCIEAPRAKSSLGKREREQHGRRLLGSYGSFERSRATLRRYYILLQIYVWENRFPNLSQKFRTTLMNLKAFSVVETSSASVTTNNY